MTDCSRVLPEAADDNRAFTVSDAGVRTRRDFALAAAGWKAAVQASGAKAVAFYFSDIFDSASALFGCWAAGVRAVLPADTSEALIERLKDEVQAVAGDFPANCPIASLTRKEAIEPCRDVIDASKPLVALFTSGSTGTPTMVVKRLSQLFCEVESINSRGHGQEKELTENTVIFSTVSQQHIYGLLFALLWPLRSARAVWHTRILYPEELLGHICKVREAAWIASPAHLNRLPEHPLWEKARPLLRAIYSSGGPLSDEGLKTTLLRTGIAPVELLGSSESGGIAWRKRSVEADGRITGTGYRPLPATQFRIENSLLVIKNPQLSTDDWETTADMVSLNADGDTFTLLGRADRIVKIEGKRVSLKTVENALLATGLVSEVKAFSRKANAQSTAERIAVAAVTTPAASRVILRDGKHALVENLRTELLKHIERVCLPRQWRFTWALPQNALGKATTQTVETLFSHQTPQAVLLEAPNADVADMVLSVPADSPYFKGHFPEFALLPGVVQVQWAKDIACRYWNLEVALFGVKALKFMSPIRPDDTVVLKLSRSVSGIAFIYQKTDGSTLSRGTLVLETEQ